MLDHPGGSNAITRSLQEQGRGVRVGGDMTREAEVEVIQSYMPRCRQLQKIKAKKTDSPLDPPEDIYHI